MSEINRCKAEKSAYKSAVKQGYGHTQARRAGIRAYCSGNKWLTENAKAVGNW